MWRSKPSPCDWGAMATSGLPPCTRVVRTKHVRGEPADEDPYEVLDQDRLRGGEVAALAVGHPAARGEDLVEIALLALAVVDLVEQPGDAVRLDLAGYALAARLDVQEPGEDL